MEISKSGIIVFDLDETIGHFDGISQLMFTIGSRIDTFPTELKQNAWYEIYYSLQKIIEIYLRPGILKCFLSLILLRARHPNFKIVLFTNHRNDYLMAHLPVILSNLIGTKHKIFDCIIDANHPQRSDKIKKPIKDLLNILNIKGPIDVCFIEDTPDWVETCHEARTRVVQVPRHALTVNSEIMVKILQQIYNTSNYLKTFIENDKKFLDSLIKKDKKMRFMPFMGDAEVDTIPHILNWLSQIIPASYI